MKNKLIQLEKSLSNAMLIDQFPLRRSISNLRKKTDISQHQLDAIENKLTASIER